MKLIPYIIAIGLLSCSPQKRLNRLVQKHPHLIQNDTIVIHDTFTIESTKFDTIIKTNQDLSGVDSVLNNFKNKLDSVTKVEMSKEIKYYITQRKSIEDTIKHFHKDLIVLIWEDENGINVNVEKPQQDIVREILVPVEKYNITNDYSFVKWLVVLLILGMGLVVFLRVWK